MSYFIKMLVFCAISLSMTTSPSVANSDKIRKAGFLIDENRHQEALSLYEEILKEGTISDDRQKSQIFNNMGYCYYTLNQAEKALLYYKRALGLNQSYPICLNNCAVIYMNRKKYQEAFPYLKRAYELDKENIKVVFNLFVVFYHLDKKDEARFYLSEAFRIDERYTEDRFKNKNIGYRDIERLKKIIHK